MATTTMEKELLGLEREYWDAMVDKNPGPPTRLTADECLVVGPPGISKIKGSEIASMVTSDDNGRIKSYNLSDVSCVQIAPDTAIIAYKVKENVEVDGKSFTVEANDATLWTKRGGKSVSAFHTESIAGDPWGRDKKTS